jgi:uncharacterized membrane protein
MIELLFYAVVCAVFAGVWWGLTRLNANAFVVPFLSALAAVLVLLSRSLLGVPL